MFQFTAFDLGYFDQAPQLTHRSLVQLALSSSNLNLTDFDYVLLNIFRHPGWNSMSEFAINIAEQLRKMPDFQLSYKQDEVILFKKVESRSSIKLDKL